MSIFQKSKKPAIWVLKFGALIVLIRMVLRFMNSDGAGAAEIMMSGGLGVVLVSLIVYICALPIYAIKDK
jgi:hypothetical protein